MHIALRTKMIPIIFEKLIFSENTIIPIVAATIGSIFANIAALLASVPESPSVYSIYGIAAERAEKVIINSHAFASLVFSNISIGFPKIVYKIADIKNV